MYQHGSDASRPQVQPCHHISWASLTAADVVNSLKEGVALGNRGRRNCTLAEGGGDQADSCRQHETPQYGMAKGFFHGIFLLRFCLRPIADARRFCLYEEFEAYSRA